MSMISHPVRPQRYRGFAHHGDLIVNPCSFPLNYTVARIAVYTSVNRLR